MPDFNFGLGLSPKKKKTKSYTKMLISSKLYLQKLQFSTILVSFKRVVIQKNVLLYNFGVAFNEAVWIHWA